MRTVRTGVFGAFERSERSERSGWVVLKVCDFLGLFSGDYGDYG